jgi:hypothetical protein
MTRAGAAPTLAPASGHYKDAVLDALARTANVAQFVSFSPELEFRFGRVVGFPDNHRFTTVSEALEALLRQSSDNSINIRSFDPMNPKSREFVYGIKDAKSADSTLNRLSAQGLFTIANETIDVCDGGVSGVALGNVIEIAPCDTPRAVEKPGIVQLPRELGIDLLELVYGFLPELSYDLATRVEFSVHPLRRGYKQTHTIVWETESVGDTHSEAVIRWPNSFSRYIGDKAFGLLIAHLLGLPVPRTTVVPRHLAPFSFGRDTGSGEIWIRTCPVEQIPGRYTTRRGWTDPYRLLQDEDPSGKAIASVLAQVGIDAQYSGALVVSESAGATDSVIIEGTRGFGDAFMTGSAGRSELPPSIIQSVRSLYRRVSKRLGPVRMEWVTDSNRTWVVQLHRGGTQSTGNIIFPGKAKHFIRFEVQRGLEALRELVQTAKHREEGIILVGDVGITSHFGDVLRKAQVPSRLESGV